MPTPAPNKPAAALPDGIEIFKAGRRTADSGVIYVITEADVAASAAAYVPQIHEAPLTVGHPEGNLPAYGWVAGLEAGAGGVLKSSHKQVEPQFAEMVGAGRFKKRSASFYLPDDPTNPVPGVWYLRHVAYLGDKPPAVKGLKDIQFSEDANSRAVNFSESTTQEHDVSKELQDQLDAANKKLADETAAREAAEGRAKTAETQAANFSEQAKAQQQAAHASFAEAQVEAGKLLPKDKASAVAVLNTLAAVQTVEFSEGNATVKVSPLEFVKNLIAGAKPAVSFGEFAPANTQALQQIQPGVAKGKTDAEIDTAAKAYSRAHKVDYAEALGAVTASFTA